jgi:hypothetical protein
MLHICYLKMEREIISYMHSTAGLDVCVGHYYLCYDLHERAYEGFGSACIVIFFKMDKRSTGFYGAHYTWTALGFHPLYGGDIALRKGIWRR